MNKDVNLPRYQDRQYLVSDQYVNSDNLDARARLHRRYSTNKQGWIRWVRSFLPTAAGSKILDCGCGPGYFWQDAAQGSLESQHIFLLDLSEGMVNAARAGLRQNQSVAAYVVGNAAYIPFADKSFATVMANHMLYHVPDRARAILELERVLKPGGRLLATTNGAKHLIELTAVRAILLPDLYPHAEQVSAAFSLENGEGQLRAAFRDIVRHRFSNRLLVTDAEDVIAYLLSSSETRRTVGAVALEETRAYLADMIEREGAYQITVDSGIFLARRG